MRRYNFLYFIGQAFKGLWRNGVMTAASVVVLVSCLLLTGTFASLVQNINYNLSELDLLNEIVLFLDKDATDESVQRILGEIDSLRNLGIENVNYISKEQALQEMRDKDSEYAHLYEDITPQDNPLADSIRITYNDSSKASTLDYKLRLIDGVRKVNNRLDLAMKIEGFKKTVSLVFAWFLAMLFILSLFVIINTVKLGVYARRDEIAVMRYVGATRLFIVTPFIIEGILIGVASAGAAFFATKELYIYILKTRAVGLDMIKVIPFDSLSHDLLIAYIIVGAVTGIVGSVISLRKNIEV